MPEDQVRSAIQEWIEVEENQEVALVENEGDLEEELDEEDAGGEAAVGQDSYVAEQEEVMEEAEEEITEEMITDVRPSIDAVDRLFENFRNRFPETYREIDRLHTVFRSEKREVVGGAQVRQQDIRLAFTPTKVMRADVFGSSSEDDAGEQGAEGEDGEHCRSNDGDMDGDNGRDAQRQDDVENGEPREHDNAEDGDHGGSNNGDMDGDDDGDA